jgi:hypothetical protein
LVSRTNTLGTLFGKVARRIVERPPESVYPYVSLPVAVGGCAAALTRR